MIKDLIAEAVEYLKEWRKPNYVEQGIKVNLQCTSCGQIMEFAIGKVHFSPGHYDKIIKSKGGVKHER